MAIAPDRLSDSIVFSLLRGTVWATSPGRPPVELGDCETVSYMMRDFLAQCDLGERMARGAFMEPTQYGACQDKLGLVPPR